MNLGIGLGLGVRCGASVAPPVLSAFSPSLGDTSAGTWLALSVTGTVTGVTVDGTACTNVEQVGPIVYCQAPALAVGAYDVACSGPGGDSNVLTGAYAAWHLSEIAGSYGWLADVGVTGNPVTALANQGSGGAAALVGTAGTNPAVVADRFRSNEVDSITFDRAHGGTGDILALGTAIDMPTALSYFWVTKQSEVLAPTLSPSIMHHPGGGGPMVGFDAGKIRLRNLDAGESYLFGAAAAYDDGAPRVYGVTYVGASGEVRGYANGALVDTVAGATFGATRMHLTNVGNGGGNPFSGEFAAAFATPSLLSDADRAKLVQWMFGKYVARSYAFNRVATTTSWKARDGAALVALGTDLYLLGGWNGEATNGFDGGNRVTNEVWKSTDSGANWTKILAGDYTYSTTANGKTSDNSRWTPRHMHQCFALGGLLYVVGSDPFNKISGSGGSYVADLTGQGTADVWTSTDGVAWTCVTSAAPWGPRVNHMAGIIGSDIYVMGGQRGCNDDSTALRDVWKSSDGGANWTQLADAPWTARGLVGHLLPTLNGKLYVIGGGVYGLGGTPPTGATLYNNDVWSFDGSTWAEVSADGVAPFARRRYNAAVAFDSKLWVLNGVVAGVNIGDVWSSPDGVTWTEQTIVPWRTSHADGWTVLGDALISKGGNGEVGQPSDPGDGNVYKITRYGVEP